MQAECIFVKYRRGEAKIAKLVSDTDFMNVLLRIFLYIARRQPATPRVAVKQAKEIENRCLTPIFGHQAAQRSLPKSAFLPPFSSNWDLDWNLKGASGNNRHRQGKKTFRKLTVLDPSMHADSVVDLSKECW